jgi:hypothetical protein
MVVAVEENKAAKRNNVHADNHSDVITEIADGDFNILWTLPRLVDTVKRLALS